MWKRKWEQNSIDKIRQIVEETRQSLFKHIIQIEDKLTNLTGELQQRREEDDITEKDLENWKDELQLLTKQFMKPLNISIVQISIPLIYQIHAEIIGE
jgi:ribosome recycling factor